MAYDLLALLALRSKLMRLSHAVTKLLVCERYYAKNYWAGFRGIRRAYWRWCGTNRLEFCADLCQNWISVFVFQLTYLRDTCCTAVKLSPTLSTLSACRAFYMWPRHKILRIPCTGLVSNAEIKATSCWKSASTRTYCVQFTRKFTNLQFIDVNDRK